MEQKLKHKLPPYAILDHVPVSSAVLNGLQSCILELQSEFKTVYEVNKSLCGIHEILANSVYKNFFQISLTDFDSKFADQTTGPERCNLHNESKFKSKIQLVKKRKAETYGVDSLLNEHLFTKKTEIYHRYSGLLGDVLGGIKGEPVRMRFVKLNAGSSVAPHIDYDPSYAVRLIIPIFSPPESVNLFWVKGRIEAVRLKPGHCYFLNIGYRHAVHNFSNEDRYTLLVTVKGHQDLQMLLSSHGS